MVHKVAGFLLLLPYALSTRSLELAEDLRSIEDMLNDDQKQVLEKVSEEDEAAPDNYWVEEEAEKRCKAATRFRYLYTFASVPTKMVMSNGILSLGLFTAFAWTMHPGFLFFAVGASIPKMMDAAKSSKGVKKIESYRDFAWLLFGWGDHFPACCCSDDGNSTEPSCLLASNPEEAMVCPSGMRHEPTMCAAPEVLTFAEHTGKKCTCLHKNDCGNGFWKGHEWCEVEPGCGRKYVRNMFKFNRVQRARRWDYCRYAENPAEVDGVPVASNKNLAKFERWGHKLQKILKGNGYKNRNWVGGYTSQRNAVALARQRWWHRPSCFAGIPVETLSLCADLCIKEGAPTGATMSGTKNHTYPCKYISYNRAQHMCVRMPGWASMSRFKPSRKSIGGSAYGSGWQNLKLSK